VIDKIPESIAGKSIQKKVEIRSKIQGEKLKTLIANADGSFCQMLKPGSYVFKVGHVVHIAVTLYIKKYMYIFNYDYLVLYVELININV